MSALANEAAVAAQVDEYDRDEKASEQAAKKGCRVVLPAPNELFVDIDDFASLAVFRKNVERLKEYMPCTWEERESPSGLPDHRHMVVTLEEDVDPFERIALQALLGSDRTREMLSWQRLQRYEANPTLFFERVPPRDPDDKEF